MRISDWSSDVCSSDLGRARHRDGHARRLVDRFRAVARHLRTCGQGLRGLSQPGAHYRPGSSRARPDARRRSEEHTSELQSLMRISYAVFCLKKKTKNEITQTI